MDILKQRNLSVKFQILVEIAENQPNVQQKDIARKLELTNQAISEYFQELKREGLVKEYGRSKYRVTREGVDWILRAYRHLSFYLERVGRAVTGITTCAAIAGANIREGQELSLVMRNGLLYAVPATGEGARAIATCSASRGEDVGVTGIEGIIPLEKGTVRLLQVPTIEEGGSRAVDKDFLEREIGGTKKLLGSIGLEALACLRKSGRKPDYLYGVLEAAVEAANSGLDFVIILTRDYLPNVLARLEEEDIPFRITDLSSKR
jgi:putative transcriptional regulator